MKHATNLREQHQSLAELVCDLGDLRYDALAEFLSGLGAKLDGDAAQDEASGRRQLAAVLRSSARHVAAASDEIKKAWGICKPHMLESSDMLGTSQHHETIIRMFIAPPFPCHQPLGVGGVALAWLG